jgi:cysteine sulfinate desulfinase/cysteine desulfurase-like protein
MKLSDSLIDSSLRISLSRFTTGQELDSFIEVLDKAMKVIMKK